MMQHASQGLRNASRKASSSLVHNNGHNGPGASTNQTRSIHLAAQIRSGGSHVPPSLSFQSVRPRTQNKLFSSSKNFLQKFFAYLTAPGIRAPVQASQFAQSGTRSLYNGARIPTIQSSLSFTARHALRNNALHRSANTFLPSGPTPPRPSFGGVAQVGLGMARNFTTGRPIFENLVQNVPVAARALYEVDWDVEMRKELACMRRSFQKTQKKARKSKEMLKPATPCNTLPVAVQQSVNEDEISQEDVDHYFPAAYDAPVTTYLLIPLAPTPTSRLPLPLERPPSPSWGPNLLPPLTEIRMIHQSHSRHALKVSSLFIRLDQANVWALGAKCTAYACNSSPQFDLEKDEFTSEDGVCTILQVTFVGWTQAQVRAVIGESGSGWCVLEEVPQEEEPMDHESLSDTNSLASTASQSLVPSIEHDSEEQSFDSAIDPAQSFFLPTLDFSDTLHTSIAESSLLEFIGDGSESLPFGMENDPWADESVSSDDSLSSVSSASDIASLIIDPPSENGWFDLGRQSGLHYERRSELPNEMFLF